MRAILQAEEREVDRHKKEVNVIQNRVEGLESRTSSSE